MADEWYGVHVGKQLRNVNSAVPGSGFFGHHALILLMGVDFLARSVKEQSSRISKAIKSHIQVWSRVNLRFPVIQRQGDQGQISSAPNSDEGK